MAALAVLMIGLRPAWADETGNCRQEGLERLRAASPDGFAIYQRVRLKDPAFFDTWVQCDDAQLYLPTAVHESTHLITSETDAFPLVGGGEIKRPHEVSGFFPPYLITKAFKPDALTAIYLRRGKATSATDFLFLLDEFNAYAHDLNAATDLKDMTRPGQSVDHRDGLAAMMAFVAAYAETARTRQPETWNGLRREPVAGTIVGLWDQAERVMAASCGIPDFGTSDRYYIRRFCAAGSRSAIGQILGRAPVCPTACLVPVHGDAQETASAEDLAPAVVPADPTRVRSITSWIFDRR